MSHRHQVLGMGGALAILMSLTGCLLDQRYVYFPSPWEPGDWAARAELPLEDVWLRTSDDVRLHGWWIPAGTTETSASTSARGGTPLDAAATAPVLLWCHGNAGNIISRLEHLALLHRAGLSSFIFDYRGYGQSGGRPSEAGLTRDAKAAYEWLTIERRVPPSRLVLFGQSLGAAVAGALAVERPATGLILETPFSSIKDMVRVYYGPLPLERLLEARYDLVGRLPRLRMPLLVIHGDEDEIVPLALGRKVYEAAPQPKEFYQLAGGGHNDLFVVGAAVYGRRIAEFARRVTSEKRL